jgi:ribosomal protein S17E
MINCLPTKRIGRIRCQNSSDYSLNRIRKLAEELFAKYPTKFSADFAANKKTLDEVAIIRNRALRNQIAGAITALAAEAAPKSPLDVQIEGEPIEEHSSEEAPEAEPVSQQAQ